MSTAPLRQWLLLSALFQSANIPSGETTSLLSSTQKQKVRDLWRHYQDAADADTFVQGLQETDYAASVRRQLDACERWCEQAGHQVVTRTMPDYPPLMATMPDAPPLLFVRGDPAVLSLPQIAMVGSRKPTSAGRRLAWQFAQQLSQAGFVITSGLALGIDAASHEGALRASGLTIAVLGTGLDRIYPDSHAALAASISERGALVSELLPGSPPRAWHFPRRNRLISGLAHGVLVVEAALSSGSLITARMAAEQGREIFAIPGPITNPVSRGCHRLLRQGAVLVEEVADILAELGGLLQWQQQAQTPQATPVDAAVTDVLSQGILAQIAYNPVSVDELATQLCCELSELLPRLLQLELAGLLECHAGRYTRRT